MRTHTNDFKETIKQFGREIDSQLTYIDNGNTVTLGNEQLNNVTPKVESSLLKSVMKEIDIDSNVDIPVDTEINYKFGVKTRSGINIFDLDYISASGITINDAMTYDFTYTDCWARHIVSNANMLKIFKTNTQYTISFKFKVTSRPASFGQYNHDSFFAIYNGSNVWISIDDALKNIGTIDTWYSTSKTFTTPSNLANCELLAYDFKDTSNNTVGTIEIKELQIQEGTQATQFERYGIYDYVDYGNYIVYSNEYSADNNAYVIKAYDKMLYSMKEYTILQSAEFPLTIREYITAICQDIGLTFANSSDTFANYNKTLQTDPYANINYTYRDILDDLAEVTASNICINDNDELEIRYINQTEGKNLFSYSDTFENPVWEIGGGVDITNTLDNSYSVKTRNAWAGPYANFKDLYDNGKIQIGDTITYSIYFKTDFVPTGTIGFSFSLYRALYNSNPIIATYNYNDIVPNKWYRISKTFVVDSYTIQQTKSRIELNYYDNTDPYYFGNSRQNAVWYARPQIEIGNLTDYECYGDTIDEEYLKDVNVTFGEKYGPVNTVVLKRSEDADGIYISNPSTLSDDEKIAITIKDNQIMNGDDRSDYLNDLLNKLKGLEYYINDYTSTGIMYYEVCDRYNVKIDDKFYKCILFNDEANITQGLVEQIDTSKPDLSENEYKYMTTEEKADRDTKLIVDKVNKKVLAQAETIEIITTNIDKETGDVNAVTTKEKHFTFNDEGLTISAGDNDFKSVSDETGTYYYDGSNKVGEYTKDGSKQKDLSLFGVYKYGMDEITDTPMFVAQLYTNNSLTPAEEGFGHFYNGDDI